MWRVGATYHAEIDDLANQGFVKAKELVASATVCLDSIRNVRRRRMRRSLLESGHKCVLSQNFLRREGRWENWRDDMLKKMLHNPDPDYDLDGEGVECSEVINEVASAARALGYEPDRGMYLD